MATDVTKRCDVCRQQTMEIVGKLFFTPLTPSNSAANFSQNYTKHCDVGVCCADKVKKAWMWRDRVPRNVNGGRQTKTAAKASTVKGKK